MKQTLGSEVRQSLSLIAMTALTVLVCVAIAAAAAHLAG